MGSRFHIKTVKMYLSNNASLFIKRFLRESVEESPRRFVMEDLGLDIMEVDLVLVELEVSETVNLTQNCYPRSKLKQIPEIKMLSILEDSFLNGSYSLFKI